MWYNLAAQLFFFLFLDNLSREKSLHRRAQHDTETDFPPLTDKRRGLLDRAFVVLNWLFPLNSLRAGKPPKRT
jgi:hypothetical protein